MRDRYIIAAPLAGRLLRLPVKAGDAVAADQVVATILPSLPALLDPRTRRDLQERLGAAEASLSEATAQVERARAVHDQAETDAERARTLRRSGVVAAQERERAELAALTAARGLGAAELRRHALEHLRDQARTLLTRFDAPDAAERLDVRSPVAGRVLRLIRESETSVGAGDPLLEIGDPADLEIAVDVLTTDAVGICADATVTIARWGGSEPLQGRVRLVEPGAFTKVSALGVEEQRVWVIIDLVSPRASWPTLGDGFRVNVAIEVARLADAVLVPASTVFRRQGGWAVFVVQDGIARERPVELARLGTPLAAIASGLTPGEQVVLFPPSAIADGRRVRVTERDAAR